MLDVFQLVGISRRSRVPDYRGYSDVGPTKVKFNVNKQEVKKRKCQMGWKDLAN